MVSEATRSVVTLRIPFYVAAPTTTLDTNLQDGTLIPIEERSPQEVTHFKETEVAAPGIQVGSATLHCFSMMPPTQSTQAPTKRGYLVQVWNPGFDITPAELITGIITERGIIGKQNRGFDIEAFLRQPTSGRDPLKGPCENGQAADKHNGISRTPQGFKALTVDSVAAYLLRQPDLSAIVGPPHTSAKWKVRRAVRIVALCHLSVARRRNVLSWLAVASCEVAQSQGCNSEWLM